MLLLCPLPQPAAERASPRWLWVRSRDGVHVDAHGEDGSQNLPRDSDCTLVLPPRQVRWHHLQLPPHPQAKRAAVLAGVLDAGVLGEPEHSHAALPSDFKGPEATWAAVTDRGALQSQLDALSSAGLRPHRIVPLLAPSDTPQALAWPHDETWSVALAGPLGVLHIGAQQNPQDLEALGPDASAAWGQLRCPSHLAGAIESAWPEQRVQVLSAQALLLQAQNSPWNLAQFAFRVSAAQRRTQGLQHAWRQLRHAPAWRPVRTGLLTALLAALVLPPSWAWRERQIQRELSAQSRALVQQSFPEVQLVIDPAVQMRRALHQLAASRGGSSGATITQLLQSLGQLPQARVTEWRWQSGQAELRIQGVTTAVLQQRLQPLGWQVSAQGPERWLVTVGAKP